MRMTTEQIRYYEVMIEKATEVYAQMDMGEEWSPL